MPARGLSRYVPLLVTVALILALGAFYAPGIIRACKFRTTINAMLTDVKGGKVRTIAKYVLPEQQQAVNELVMQPFVGHYAGELGSLKLSNYYREDNHIWAVVTAKQQDGAGLGQGKLRWVWAGKQWKFDALNSYVSVGLIGVHEEEVHNIGEMWRDFKAKQPGDAEEFVNSL